MKILFKWMALSWVIGMSSWGCGYSFQGSHPALVIREGVQKVYIPPVVNNTYKPGVENWVFNQLTRTLLTHRMVTLVSDPEQADAVLQGTVASATYVGSAGAPVSMLNPMGLGSRLPSKAFIISTIYTANLTCSFSLIGRRGEAAKKGVLWTSSFARSKQFSGANQLDVPGTTSALINESEFDRALQDLVRNMMDDVHESMLAMF